MDVVIKSGINQLAAYVCQASEQRGGVVFIGGGGQIGHAVARPWQDFLQQNGYSSLAFDFPGVGGSSGRMADSSLATRLQDVEAALDYFLRATSLTDRDVVFCGRSMGAPLALRLATAHHQTKVILLFPAAYAAEAFDKKFDETFSQVIRQPNSWADSPDFDYAQNFDGQLMVIYGDQDAVIPPAIQQRYLAIAKKHGRSLILPGAGHNKRIWDDDPLSTANRLRLFEQTQLFLNDERSTN